MRTWILLPLLISVSGANQIADGPLFQELKTDSKKLTCQNALDRFLYETRNPGLPSSERKPYFHVLDERTLSDLDLSSTIDEVYAPYLPRTELGYLRLHHIAKFPLMDARMIRSRQSLAKELIANPGVLASLQEVLDELAPLVSPRLLANFVHKRSFHIDDKSKKLEGIVGTNLANVRNFGLLGAGALVIHPFILGAAFLPGLLSSDAAQAKFDRVGYAAYSKIFDKMQVISEVLSGAKLPLLRDMGRLLASVGSQDHYLGVYEVAKASRWNHDSDQLLLLDVLFRYGRYTSHFVDKKIRRAHFSLTLLFSILAEIDVAVTFAESYLARPEVMTFPEILDPTEEEKKGNPKYSLEFKMGHHPIVYFSKEMADQEEGVERDPVIVSAKRENTRSVANDFQLATRTEGSGVPHILVVTGCNAAGKSTYLRLIGLLSIMGQTGGPVFAKSARMTPVRLMTSIQNVDSVRFGKSFYDAESDRVVEATNFFFENEGVFLILDEIFRGTNHDEKHAGEQAFMEAFGETNNMVVHATHDETVAESSQRISGVRNIHFDSTYERNQLSYDYRVKEGPSQTTNAIDMLEMKGANGEVLRRAREILRRKREEEPK